MKQIGNKTPDNGTPLWIGEYSACGEKKQCVTSPRNFGTYPKGEERKNISEYFKDWSIEDLNNSF